MQTDSDDSVAESLRNQNDTSGGDSTTHTYIWTDRRGRSYVSDGEEMVRLNRLTAVAEHGVDEVADSHVHHAVSANLDGEPVRVNVPEWLLPLGAAEHRRLHGGEEHVDVEGIPMLAPDDSLTEPVASSDANDTVARETTGD